MIIQHSQYTNKMISKCTHGGKYFDKIDEVRLSLLHGKENELSIFNQKLLRFADSAISMASNAKQKNYVA